MVAIRSNKNLGLGVKLWKKLGAENTENAGSGSHSSGTVEARML